MTVPQNGLRLQLPLQLVKLRNKAGCYCTNFSTLSIKYSKVCGMAVGFQKGQPDAAFRSINNPYVDGVSITYGSPKKHLWTYAIGISEGNESKLANCPCSKFPGLSLPSFVHKNYYCESGMIQIAAGYFTDDPVWDGKNCSSENNCCADPSLPWFYCQLPLTASEDIETRICCDEASSNEDVLVRDLQLYVQ